MRILIDMQGLQTVSRVRGSGRNILSLVLDMARNNQEHELHLLVNAAFQDSILNIRHAFAGLIPEQHIHVFEVAMPIAGNNSANSGRFAAAEIIYAHFIRGLNPDILLLTQNLSAGWADNTVMPITPLQGSIQTGLLWLEKDSAFSKVINGTDLAHGQWSLNKLKAYTNAQLIIASSKSLRSALIEKWALPEQQVVALETQDNNADITGLGLIKVLEAVYQPITQAIEPLLNFQKQRPRLAFVSPLPPEKTGIADYSAELLPELARFYDIELITDQPLVSDLGSEFDFPIRTVAWFKQHAGNYQRVLYHLGNNQAFHGHMFALLKEIPGVVVLHDFFLAHVMAGMETSGYQPQAWAQALFHSHGYPALQQCGQTSAFNHMLWHYPCNLEVMQDALGVIVHSKNSQRLASQWLGTEAGTDWGAIPLLRAPAVAITRSAARQALAWHKDYFIVCSFGVLGASKHNQRLFDAWLSSALAKNEQCRLVFVGENDAGDYGKQLVATIKNSGLEQRILITGWTDTEQFRQYLAAADLGVQLRTLSRGETSAAVLDCMNYGLPTIVNANGAMVDLPIDAVYRLPDEFSDSDMVTALETLWQDSEQRQRLASAAHKLILSQHNPSICAQRYAQTIESLYQRAAKHSDVVVQALAGLANLPADDHSLASLAKAVAASFPPQPLPRQLLIDVSSIARHDLKTGIERVVRSQLLVLLNNPPVGFRIEPVYLTDQNDVWHYRYARTYTCNLLGISQDNLKDTAIDINAGDVFYAPDFFPAGVVEAHKAGLYLQYQARGVAINFLIHDLLPVQKPEFFPVGADSLHVAWLKTIAECATGLICISQAVADALHSWLQINEPVRKTPLPIAVIHHGADISSAPFTGEVIASEQLLTALKTRPSFIMVGTLEPRKGHLQTLAAFELLWQQEEQINLVIVGKAGWNGLPDEQRRTIPELLAKLQHHKELDQRLFWLEGISDEYLEQLYAASTCLIAASEGEGFGLPLIEAAQHQLPIIARDIAVFREVAGEHAYYFSGHNAVDLQQALSCWLKRYTTNTQPASTGMAYLSWAENATQLGCLLSDGYKNSNKCIHSEYMTKSRLYVDISVVYRKDRKSGIQRVVRAILLELMNNPPDDYSICPVYIDNVSGIPAYYSVPTYNQSAENSPIIFSSEDILLGLDLTGGYVVEASQHGIYRQLMETGVRVYFVVYDLLPVLTPQFFNLHADEGHEQWLRCIAKTDGVICISKAVAHEFATWAQSLEQPLADDFSIDFFHLGADIAASEPSAGLPDDAELTLSLLALRPSFLMVGTVEPRKGYAQTLAAFELLWQQGMDANLVIVGKEGWEMTVLADRLHQHPELGKRLFWQEGISDEYLEQLYAASTCLIAASEGEGFGLPLIEATQHKLPIIARNIPVFCEVAGDHAYYFEGLEAQTLAQAIQAWLLLYAQGTAPKSSGMAWLTWEQSAQQLLQKIIRNYSTPSLLKA